MLLEQNFPQLSFEIDNPGAPNTIYITDDPTVNKLVLKITTNTANTQFSAGKLVPINEAPDSTGSDLYLDLSALQLTAEQFGKLECVADGWDYKLYAPALVCLAPKGSITLGNGPGQEIAISINKLTMSKAPSDSVSLNVNYFRVPPATYLDSVPQLSFFSVSIQNAPGGHKDLHDAISCELGSEPYICNTIPDYDPVANSISVLLKAGPTPVTVNAGPQTVFVVSFVYAAGEPGYGALTTPQKAIKDITVQPGQNASAWHISLDSDAENPSWRLVPPDGAPIIGASSKSTVQFDINNIITTFKPGPTIMTVQYKHVPGYDDGSYSILLTKIPHVAIGTITVTPNPSYLDGKGEASVHLQWDVSDAGTLILYPEVKIVTGKSSYDTTIQKTTTFTLLANGKQLSANGNVASKPVAATVLPKINSFTANPAGTYYKSFPNSVGLAWNVASHNKVKLISSVTGPSPYSFDPVGGVTLSISKPQLMTLVPEGVSDPLLMRTLVLSAFKLDSQTVFINDTPMAQMVAMPTGNIIFGVFSAWNNVRVVDTLTFKPAIPPVNVGRAPKGIAISPDGKLLYVTNSKDATVSVLQVALTGLDNVTVTPLSTISNVGTTPYAVALSPLGDQLYVTNAPASGNGSVLVYNKSADNQFTHAATIDVHLKPEAIAVSSSGDYIYVANRGSNNMSVIIRSPDSSFSIFDTIKTGKEPAALAATSNGQYIFVCNYADGNVSVISTKTLSVVGAPLDAGKHPAGVAVTYSSDYVFVSNSIESTVSLIGFNNTSGLYEVLVKDIKVSDGYGAEGIAISPSSNQVFVACGGNSYELNAFSMVAYEQATSVSGLNMQPTSSAVNTAGTKVLVWHNPKIQSGKQTQGALVIDSSNYKYTQAFAGLGIYDIAYAPDGKLMYVVQSQDNAVSVHVKDATSYTDKGTISGLTGTPDKVFVSVDGSLLFVSLSKASGTNNGVAIVQTSDLKVLATVALQPATGASFLPLAATPDMNKIFVAQNNVVSIIEKGHNGYALQSKTIPVGNLTNTLGILQDGSRVITVASQGHTICIIDTAKLTVKSIVIPDKYSNNITGLAISPDGSNIVVSDIAGGTILFVDMTTYNVIYTVTTDQFPQYPVYLPDASQIFVPCLLPSTVAVIKQIQPA
jgi:YVTN family beta-propeller protein